MADYYDQQWTPKPDRHGEFSYPIDSTGLVAPYGDQHDDSMGFAYPNDSSGDVHPAADDHCNDQFVIHAGQPKPGSFKEQQTPRPKQPPVL
jgi:hypothetical protein